MDNEAKPNEIPNFSEKNQFNQIVQIQVIKKNKLVKKNCHRIEEMEIKRSRTFK